jgi:hypothetical protein
MNWVRNLLLAFGFVCSMKGLDSLYDQAAVSTLALFGAEEEDLVPGKEERECHGFDEHRSTRPVVHSQRAIDSTASEHHHL